MESTAKPSKPTLPVTIVVVLLIITLFTGGVLGYIFYSYRQSGRILDLQRQLSTAQNDLSTLQSELDILQDSTNLDNLNLTGAVEHLDNKLSTIQTQIDALQTESNSESQDVASLQATVASLQSQLTTLQTHVASFQTSAQAQYVTYLLSENFSLTQLFNQVKTSVVVIQATIRNVDIFGRVYITQVQGSGFVYRYSTTYLILTNNHVVSGASNITVTFTTGNNYSATIRGSNPGTDFAVLTTPSAPQSVYQPLQITTSSTLSVGDPVIVVGAPYGLDGSMTNGIVSALNRTLTTDMGSTLTNVIQSTAPLNPGNSGGPLMNYNGQVVGITTAIVSESQGIGFAIPSDTVLSEIQRIMST